MDGEEHSFRLAEPPSSNNNSTKRSFEQVNSGWPRAGGSSVRGSPGVIGGNEGEHGDRYKRARSESDVESEERFAAFSASSSSQGSSAQGSSGLSGDGSYESSSSGSTSSPPPVVHSATVRSDPPQMSRPPSRHYPASRDFEFTYTPSPPIPDRMDGPVPARTSTGLPSRSPSPPGASPYTTLPPINLPEARASSFSGRFPPPSNTRSEGTFLPRIRMRSYAVVANDGSNALVPIPDDEVPVIPSLDSSPFLRRRVIPSRGPLPLPAMSLERPVPTDGAPSSSLAPRRGREIPGINEQVTRSSSRFARDEPMESAELLSVDSPRETSPFGFDTFSVSRVDRTLMEHPSRYDELPHHHRSVPSREGRSPELPLPLDRRSPSAEHDLPDMHQFFADLPSDNMLTAREVREGLSILRSERRSSVSGSDGHRSPPRGDFERSRLPPTSTRPPVSSFRHPWDTSDRETEPSTVGRSTSVGDHSEYDWFLRHVPVLPGNPARRSDHREPDSRSASSRYRLRAVSHSFARRETNSPPPGMTLYEQLPPNSGIPSRPSLSTENEFAGTGPLSPQTADDTRAFAWFFPLSSPRPEARGAASAHEREQLGDSFRHVSSRRLGSRPNPPFGPRNPWDHPASVSRDSPRPMSTSSSASARDGTPIEGPWHSPAEERRRPFNSPPFSIPTPPWREEFSGPAHEPDSLPRRRLSYMTGFLSPDIDDPFDHPSLEGAINSDRSELLSTTTRLERLRQHVRGSRDYSHPRPLSPIHATPSYLRERNERARNTSGLAEPPGGRVRLGVGNVPPSEYPTRPRIPVPMMEARATGRPRYPDIDLSAYHEGSFRATLQRSVEASRQRAMAQSQARAANLHATAERYPRSNNSSTAPSARTPAAPASVPDSTGQPLSRSRGERPLPSDRSLPPSLFRRINRNQELGSESRLSTDSTNITSLGSSQAENAVRRNREAAAAYDLGRMQSAWLADIPFSDWSVQSPTDEFADLWSELPDLPDTMDVDVAEHPNDDLQEALHVLRSDEGASSIPARLRRRRPEERPRTSTLLRDALESGSESLRTREERSIPPASAPPRNATARPWDLLLPPSLRSTAHRSQSRSPPRDPHDTARSHQESMRSHFERQARLRAMRTRVRQQSHGQDDIRSRGELPLHLLATRYAMRRNLGDYVRDEDFDPSYETLLSLASSIGDVRPRSTPEHIIASMPTGFYKDWAEAESDTRCPICLDDYKSLDPVLKMHDCRHWLHKECLEKWLRSATSCPVCREQVRLGSGPSHAPVAGPSTQGQHHGHDSDEGDSDEIEWFIGPPGYPFRSRRSRRRG